MEQKLEQVFGSYLAWKADEATWIISFMNGTEYMYLLEGEERALLLDTGYGAGNLRAFVETLTQKQVAVANTHFHPDHAAGNGEFERVYMAEGALLDAPSVETPGAVPFDLSKLPHPDYEKVFIKEGFVFDLGGRKVEVLDVKPAHCNSSLFFLDRGHRMFFCGDDLEAAQVMLFDNSKNPQASYEVGERLDNFRANNVRIRDLADAYDYLFPNHNGTPIAKSYAQDYISLVDGIYDGTAVIEEKLNHPFVEMDPAAKELCRVRCKKASIFIKKEELRKVYHNRTEG
ncbi:MAG: MBL fold metallo-hydrolase [Eubacterium sp.]|nr:MBL fold metallo-hydrolase [Eubacterium sp.]